MALSYEYSIGSVRAKEKSLLNSSDIEQMLSYNSEDELLRFLVDKGYGEGSNIDEVISAHTKDIWDYLKTVAPDFDIFNVFLIQNDAHNLKVILKSIILDKRHDELLLSPFTIDTQLIKKAVEQKKFDILPEWLSAAAGEAYNIIAHKTDARECDAVIDKAVMEQMIVLSKEPDSKFIEEYINTVVFYNNIKIALRSSRTNASADFLDKALCDVDEFRKTSVIAATLKGIDFLMDELGKYSEYECDKAIEQFKISPTAFECFVDDKLTVMAKESCKRLSEGADPLIGYYLGNEAEKKVIHIISSGFKTNTDKDIIRERLREIYG
ncbi:MAG: V-type ATPase subunit [Ruminococcus sp.]|nr:V-type ATPase subunit [Ruminococcus sp.]